MRIALARAGLCLVLVSCRTAPAPAGSSDAAAGGVPREALLARMPDFLPPRYCKEGGYLRTCFRLSEAECLTTAREATESCVGQYRAELPDPVPESVLKPWGAKLGTCVGTSFLILRAAAMVDSERCSDADYWARETRRQMEDRRPPDGAPAPDTHP